MGGCSDDGSGLMDLIFTTYFNNLQIFLRFPPLSVLFVQLSVIKNKISVENHFWLLAKL